VNNYSCGALVSEVPQTQDHDNMKALNSSRCTVLQRIGDWQLLLLSSVPDCASRVSSRLRRLLTTMSQPKRSAARPSTSAFRPTGKLSVRPVAAMLAEDMSSHAS